MAVQLEMHSSLGELHKCHTYEYMHGNTRRMNWCLICECSLPLKSRRMPHFDWWAGTHHLTAYYNHTECVSQGAVHSLETKGTVP